MKSAEQKYNIFVIIKHMQISELNDDTLYDFFAQHKILKKKNNKIKLIFKKKKHTKSFIKKKKSMKFIIKKKHMNLNIKKKQLVIKIKKAENSV